MNNKGQAGAVFKLMVDGIVGLVILVIIFSLLMYFDSLRYANARSEVRDIVQTAYNNPTGIVVSQQKNEKLPFLKDEFFFGSHFAASLNSDKECFVFITNSPAIEILSNSIRFNQNLNSFVSAKCNTLSGASLDYVGCSSSCNICCAVSFGKKLVDD
jgi:hypothetical protein